MVLIHIADLDDCLEIASQGAVYCGLLKKARQLEKELLNDPESYITTYGSVRPEVVAESLIKTGEEMTDANFERHYKQVHLLTEDYIGAALSIAKAIEQDKGAASIMLFDKEGLEKYMDPNDSASVFVPERLSLSRLEMLLISPKGEARLDEVKKAYKPYSSVHIYQLANYKEFTGTERFKKIYREHA